jgi:ubiquinone/menaquinone biosynthesis C-methylase UbiE
MIMDYYQIAKTASSQIGSHEGLLYLQNLCKSADRILDVGCGEGTRLQTLLLENGQGFGLDPSRAAIARAKKQYPGHHFTVGSGEKLPFKNNNFDLVYSAFAVEHCADPEKFIQEMVRVTKNGGYVVILAPNYGAPGRRSPNSVENPYNKLLEGLVKDLFPYPGLDWQQVVPKTDYREIDSDTTFEPYLKSLIYFLKQNKLEIIRYSSLWSLENSGANFRKLIIRYLGQFGIWPFCYWGPQLFVCAKKISQTTVPESANTTI